MEELKTLKDLEELYDHGIRPATIDIPSSHLKQEAIKHIKDMQEAMSIYANTSYTQGKIDIFKHFFNITEEDLKDGD